MSDLETQHHFQAAQGIAVRLDDVVQSGDGSPTTQFRRPLRTSMCMQSPNCVHVVETDTAPRTRIGLFCLHVKVPGNEPLGQRIVEAPDDAKQRKLGNAHTAFATCVPKSSIRRGAALFHPAATPFPAAPVMDRI
jgi:uncharacterized protein YlaI